MRWYSPMLVPGLLQTEEYARSVISSGLLIAPPGEIERRVQVKMTRQKVLAREDPLTLDVILDEAAVLRMVGGAGGYARAARAPGRDGGPAQHHRAGASAGRRAHPATTGEFTILAFPDWWPRTWCTWRT